MKNRKYMYVDFAFYDRTGIERFLEKQAAKGWLLEGIGGLLWHFTRIEPKNVHFTVTFYQETIDLDEGPSEQFIEYLEYCARSGWRFVDTVGYMQIFYTELEVPTPIETDALLELEVIHETVKEKHLKYMIAMSILTGITFLLRLFLLIRFSPTVQEQIEEGLCTLSYLFYTCYFSIDLIRYFRWKKKAEKEARLYGTYTGTKSLPYMRSVLAVLFMISTLLLWVGSNITGKEIIGVLVFIAVTCLITFIASYFGGKKKDKVMRNLKAQIHTEP